MVELGEGDGMVVIDVGDEVGSVDVVDVVDEEKEAPGRGFRV